MKLSITALVATLFAVGVYAQEPVQEPEPQQEPQSQSMDVQSKDFTQLDANQDGILTEQEAEQAGIEAVAFDSLDQDKDQEVSEEEFNQAKEGGAAR